MADSMPSGSSEVIATVAAPALPGKASSRARKALQLG